MKTRTKTSQPRVGVFLAQPHGTLVGEGKPFADHWDLCRWLGNKGADGVTIPACAPFIDISQATGPKAATYCAEQHQRYQDCGVELLRMENHVPDGQFHLMSSLAVGRFAGFAPNALPHTVESFEQFGAKVFADAIRASANMGFKQIVTFSGARAWHSGLYPWPGYPKEFQKWVIALLVHKWKESLELAAAEGVTVGFECHPVQDINSPFVLKFVRDALEMLGSPGAKATKANADASHDTLVGIDAAAQFEFLFDNGLLGMCHLKDGKIVDMPGAGLYGDYNSVWSQTRRHFRMFGTGDADWARIMAVLRDCHTESEDGFDLVVEAECSFLPDMMQGLEVGIENARRARDGQPLLEVSSIVPKRSKDNWEDFCTSDHQSAAEALEMNADETAACADLVEMFNARR